MTFLPNRLYRGDCLKLLPTLPDNSIDFICSDLPYNISGKGGLTKVHSRVVPANFGAWDQWETEDDYFAFVFAVCKAYHRLLKPNASAVLFLSYYTGGWIAKELERQNLFSFRGPLIFAKENPLPNIRQSGFRSCFEQAFWLMKHEDGASWQPRTFNFISQQAMKNVQSYRIGPGYKKSQHPTEKPEYLIQWLVEVFTNPGDVVLDSFAGGGTTPAACKQAGRRYIAMEQDMRYFDLMCERLGAKR